MSEKYDFQKMADTISDRNDEIAELRAELAEARTEVERLRADLQKVRTVAEYRVGRDLKYKLEAMTAERDALQARIDGADQYMVVYGMEGEPFTIPTLWEAEDYKERGYTVKRVSFVLDGESEG